MFSQSLATYLQKLRRVISHTMKSAADHRSRIYGIGCSDSNDAKSSISQSFWSEICLIEYGEKARKHNIIWKLRAVRTNVNNPGTGVWQDFMEYQ